MKVKGIKMKCLLSGELIIVRGGDLIRCLINKETFKGGGNWENGVIIVIPDGKFMEDGDR